MVQQWEAIEIDIDGRTFWVRPVSSWVLDSDKMVAGLGGYGETVERIEELSPAMERAFASGLPSCINVKSKSVISPLIVGLTDRRVRASIE